MWELHCHLLAAQDNRSWLAFVAGSICLFHGIRTLDEGQDTTSMTLHSISHVPSQCNASSQIAMISIGTTQFESGSIRPSSDRPCTCPSCIRQLAYLAPILLRSSSWHRYVPHVHVQLACGSTTTSRTLSRTWDGRAHPLGAFRTEGRCTWRASRSRTKRGLARLTSWMDLDGFVGRVGGQNLPFYRIFVADARAPRDGRHLEVVGHYDPIPGKDGNKHVGLNLERIKYWLSVGALPSQPVARILGQAGLIPMPPARKGVPSEKTKKKT